MKRLIRWWTLEHSTQAADLLFKLVGILVALAALDFFALKPDLSWEVSGFQWLVDLDHVKSIYQSENMDLPLAVEQVIERINLGPSLQDLLLAAFSEGTVVVRRDFPSLVDFTPKSSISSALQGLLSQGDLNYALQAVEDSTYAVIRVEVSNAGQVVAEDVKVSVSLQSFTSGAIPFDLPPGTTQIVTFRTSLGTIPAIALSSWWVNPSSSDAVVTYETPRVLDQTRLILLGSLLFVFWLFTVAKEIGVM